MNGNDLQERIVAILEAHDGLSMDVPEERELIAAALARSLDMCDRQSVEKEDAAVRPPGLCQGEVAQTSATPLAESDQQAPT